jgi:AraC-like DNA-binding protein
MSHRQPAAQPIQRWSTETVAPHRRLDLYAEALTTAVDPMHVSSRRSQEFNAVVRSGGGDAVSVIQATGSPHRCVRDERDISASGERCFHLIINTSSSWQLVHRGTLTLRPMDAVMLDSYLPHQIKLPEFSITHLRMSLGWIQQWLNTPASLVGRVLPHDAGWSRALSSFVARLTPEFIVNPPIPEHLVVDHVGVTLALIANEINHAGREPGAAERSLFERISEILAQRSVESALTVDDVARDAGISTRTLHRCLAAHGHTFGERLIDERFRRAIHMLSFPANDRLPVGEIGRRAGFADPSHFARSVRQRTGMTPSAIRRSR